MLKVLVTVKVVNEDGEVVDNLGRPPSYHRGVSVLQSTVDMGSTERPTRALDGLNQIYEMHKAMKPMLGLLLDQKV